VSGPTKEAIRNPYAIARAWLRSDPRVRVAVNRQRVSDFHRMLKLGDARGERLDALGACFAMVVWVAGAAAARFQLERDARFAALVALLEEYPPESDRDDPDASVVRWRKFLELRASRPKLREVKRRAA